MINQFQKRSALLLISAIFTLSLFAQNSNRAFHNYKEENGTIKIKVSDGHYHITPQNDFSIHTAFYPKNKEVKNFSFAVEEQPSNVEYTIKNTTTDFIINTAGIVVKIDKSPLKISYYYKGNLLIYEKEGYSATDSLQKLNFGITKDEILYGGGSRVLGMNHRGYNLELYNRAHYGYETHSELMNYTLPVFISSKKYALLFDNASIGHLDLDSQKNNTINYQSVSGTMNYYVIAGNNWYNLVENYTDLTGRQPLPPRWAFGNFSSRFGYHSQEEVEATIEKFHTDSIPVDAVIIDIYWFGPEITGSMGNLNWYRDSFPKPDEMISKLKGQGVNTILVTEPFILTTSDRWDEAVNAGAIATDTLGNPYTYDFYFGNTGLVDLYKEEGRTWFWNIYKDFTKQGIAGWWGDLGEPEVHPSALQHGIGSADEVHNAYGHEWAKLIFDGYKKDFPEQRPFILMRSGFAGSQRYGLIPWTGDVNRSWGGLVPQTELSLQMGMQGLAYMHSDLGGFGGGEVIDDELYVRWLQYGVFQPIYRPHAQEHIPSEPVFQKEETKALAKEAINLRYKLKPYIYNMAFENNRHGKPLMIPLFFNDSTNANLLTYDEAYMWGDAFLVAPVKAKAKKEQQIYLPAGSAWTNFYTKEIYQGGQKVTIPLSMQNIPVFVKGASFVPMAKISNEQNYSLKEFDMHFYADASTSETNYKMYNDDGKTPEAFEKGMSETFSFTAKSSTGILQINWEKEQGEQSNLEANNTVNLSIHNLTEKPNKLSLNDKKLKSKDWLWNENTKTLSIILNISTEAQKLDISL